MGPKIERFEGYVPYTWMADTIIRPDGYYKLSSIRLFGYPVWICARETGVSAVMWSYFLNGKSCFSDAVLSHICDLFAIPASLVKDVQKYQKIEWLRRKGLSDQPCEIPSHYAHYFEEIDIDRHRRLTDKSNPVMQSVYEANRKNPERLTSKISHSSQRASTMQQYIENRHEERKRLEAEAVADAEASIPDGERSPAVLPGAAKGKPTTRLVRR